MARFDVLRQSQSQRPKRFMSPLTNPPAGCDAASEAGDAAPMLGLKSSTLRMWVAEGKIGCVRLGCRVLIPVEAIDESVQRRFQPARISHV